MNTVTIMQLFVFLLAGFVGFQTISRIPPLLHTPLMAATNAISGISLVASLVLAGANYGLLATLLGTVAVACAMANVVGGFLITDRMLAMFKRAPSPKTGASERSAAKS
ncbi:NAD(P) transhydrogenase subunit alpha [Dyella psychrodurans]|uniref:proton-translocating NAD(P)(+) transhydrogenase n=1 Tax=Dyella psychrodurans TaxID=1927960 RepID=A0A370WXV4_9GAMM|nr:NAD(P) transhydrogenase subunit alpha [Dyella psychrodurans]RDS80983.1 NAD(P) transhydrogenase subunit alpha [Dyella psychrodurans]